MVTAKMIIERDGGSPTRVGREHARSVVGDAAHTRAWNLGVFRCESSGVPSPGRPVVR
jgi:hypothetical protein